MYCVFSFPFRMTTFSLIRRVSYSRKKRLRLNVFSANNGIFPPVGNRWAKKITDISTQIFRIRLQQTEYNMVTFYRCERILIVNTFARKEWNFHFEEESEKNWSTNKKTRRKLINRSKRKLEIAVVLSFSVRASQQQEKENIKYNRLWNVLCLCRRSESVQLKSIQFDCLLHLIHKIAMEYYVHSSVCMHLLSTVFYPIFRTSHMQ